MSPKIYQMKLINKLLLVCICALSCFFVSCKREIDPTIVSTTPPALQVVVKDASNNAVGGASVKLYADETAWNNEAAALSTKQTAADGTILFTKEELKSPGIFYVIVASGGLKAKARSPYLILNDGKTYLNVVLK
jgi:hypothetical protein